MHWSKSTCISPGSKEVFFYFLLVITKFTEFDWFCTTTQLRDNVTSVIAQRPTSYGSFAYEKTLFCNQRFCQSSLCMQIFVHKHSGMKPYKTHIALEFFHFEFINGKNERFSKNLLTKWWHIPWSFIMSEKKRGKIHQWTCISSLILR